MTLEDLAKKLNYSIATVSRVLNNDTKFKVKEETREKIIDFAIKNGYKIKKKKINSNEVLIITSFTKLQEGRDPYYTSIRLELEKELKRKFFNYKIVKYKDKMKYNKCNILLGSFSKEVLKRISDNGKINILCDSYSYEKNIDSVSFDYKSSVYDVLNYLVNNSCEKIAFIGGRDEENRIDFREEYYRKFFIKRKKLNEEYIYIKDFDSKTGYIGTKEIFKKNKIKPKAIFLANDNLAVGCYKAINELGFKIPEDINVIGFNNSGFSEFMNPPLTTVDLFIENIVKETIKLMIEQLKSKRNYSKKIMLDTKIIQRNSVKETVIR